MSADPDMTFDHDIGGKPAKFRYGSVRFWQRYAKSLKELMATSGESFTDDLLALVQSCIEGDHDIGDLLTFAGLIELAHELPTLAAVSDMQKKRLPSPLPSQGDNYAKDAETESAATRPGLEPTPTPATNAPLNVPVAAVEDAIFVTTETGT